MPQNDYVDEFRKQQGRRFDHEERQRKKEAREPHARSQAARNLHGLKAKQFNQKRFKEKIQMKKTLKMHEEKDKLAKKDTNPTDQVPAFLLDRGEANRAKVLSNTLKQKRRERAGKWKVPVPKVKPLSEAEMFKVVFSGKRRKKAWKRMVDKACFVGNNFTRKNPKYERFIRPSGMRFRRAHVTHPELKTTFCLNILGVKKNPQSAMYTSLGVITKGTVLEVNVSELGLVTPGGKVVWGKYAQVTNNPELDGCVNAVLLV